MDGTVTIFKDDTGRWFAHYETLDLIADGDTEIDAQLNLLYVITNYFDFGADYVDDLSQYPTIH